MRSPRKWPVSMSYQLCRDQWASDLAGRDQHCTELFTRAHNPHTQQEAPESACCPLPGVRHLSFLNEGVGVFVWRSCLTKSYRTALLWANLSMFRHSFKPFDTVPFDALLLVCLMFVPHLRVQRHPFKSNRICHMRRTQQVTYKPLTNNALQSINKNKC